MFSNFKISRITAGEGGVEVIARLYEGEISTEMEDQGDGPISVTRFRRNNEKGIEIKLNLPAGTSESEIFTSIKQEMIGKIASPILPEQK